MGKLVAIDGPDHVGKSTLVQHLDLQFRERGFTVAHFRFPIEGDPRAADVLYEVFARSIDPMRRQIEIVNMFNAFAPKILGALRTHDIVLVDRYMLSVLVTCRALGLDTKPILEALRSAFIPPDVTLVYTGEPFTTPDAGNEQRTRFRDEAARLFGLDFPEYRQMMLRVTNEAARVGRFPAFVQHLADQMLGLWRWPLRKGQAPTAR